MGRKSRNGTGKRKLSKERIEGIRRRGTPRGEDLRIGQRRGERRE